MDRDTFLKDVKRRSAEFDYRDAKIKGKAPTVAELRQWRRSYQNADGTLNVEKAIKADEALLAIVLVDANGQPLMSMAEVYDGALDAHDAAEVNRLCTQVSVFCGIDPSELRDIRDAAKNSYGSRASESSTSLPPGQDEA